jgi:hypothetical protein
MITVSRREFLIWRGRYREIGRKIEGRDRKIEERDRKIEGRDRKIERQRYREIER